MSTVRVGTCDNPYCRGKNSVVLKATRRVNRLDWLMMVTCYSCGGARDLTFTDAYVLTLPLHEINRWPASRDARLRIPAPPPFGAGPATQR